jgi:predicted flap endonuclease-1-like 5' DNA nuclease
MGSESEDDFGNLFADLDLGSHKLGKSEEDKNKLDKNWKTKFNILQTEQLEKDDNEVGELKNKIAFFETQNIELDKKFTMEKLAFKEKEDALNIHINNLNNEKKDFKVQLSEKSHSEHKDNLKLIKGIGEVLEVGLNKLGIYQFEQIASWDERKVEEINEQLSFTGRIEREEWIEQAKKLHLGEETEFSQRVSNGEVPTSKKD